MHGEGLSDTGRPASNDIGAWIDSLSPAELAAILAPRPSTLRWDEVGFACFAGLVLCGAVWALWRYSRALNRL